MKQHIDNDHEINNRLVFIIRQTIFEVVKVAGGIELTLFVVRYELFICQ